MSRPKVTQTKKRQPLSRELIMRTGITIADADGIDSLTMRKLADALRVEAMSLYYHVKNKDELLDGMIDLVVAEIALPSGDEDWKTAMRNRAISAHDVFGRHPWVTGLMESRPNPGPHALRYYDEVLGSLMNNGFSVAMAAHAFSAIDAYIYGFGLQEFSLPFEDEHDVKDIAKSLLEQLGQEYPNLARMIVEHALQPGYRYADEFTFGLDLILDGFERLVAAD